MLPWQRAKKWQEEHSPIPFEVVLGEYLKNGYVWSSPGEFVLGRTAFWDGEEMVFDGAEHNCWVVQLAAGLNPMKRFLKVAPMKMEFVSWQRDGEERWHVWEWNKFKKKVYNNGKH